MHRKHCHACHTVILCLKRRNPSFLEHEALWFEPLEGKRSPAALPVLTKPCLMAEALESRLVPSRLRVRGSLLLLAEWAFGTAARSGSGLEAPRKGDIGCIALRRAFEQACPCPAAGLPNQEVFFLFLPALVHPCAEYCCLLPRRSGAYQK